MNLSLFPPIPRKENPVHLLVNFYFELKGWDDMPKEFYKEEKISYGRNVKAAKDLFELCENDLQKAKDFLERLKEWAEETGMDWTIETGFKRYFELTKGEP